MLIFTKLILAPRPNMKSRLRKKEMNPLTSSKKAKVVRFYGDHQNQVAERTISCLRQVDLLNFQATRL